MDDFSDTRSIRWIWDQWSPEIVKVTTRNREKGWY
jgi:hypothetical protein